MTKPENSACSCTNPYNFERAEITPAMDAVIEKAVQVLSRDGLVVYPTETIYGLGADALSEIAVYKVYEAKQRPMGKPISVAVSDIEMIHGIAYVDEFAERFISKFLPGPVTVVLPVKSCLPSDLTGGTGTIGIRYPDHAVALSIIAGLDSPITATSANISGEISPVTSDQVNVAHDFLIDGGVLPGTPSTVINLAERKIERPGAMLEEIAAFLKEER
ncbi:Threonylcarbamoyl-AMP synthase [Methanocorpusculaceae archaeon Sp1]|uniref:L-threonylcarbamoyladenylate synthase n=2 Tax=Methanorbis furvi TaxID=3028299 RepID=A0AAE4MB15_9EURY|nr:Threonylcarbamoyl-AMP synthase [Methanocorpusculaceae archaeon Sp1]MDV0441565.1 Threonylcarbamoyl-AMP synthase [Methanocorpusculaceae archaeon Ag1]